MVDRVLLGIGRHIQDIVSRNGSVVVGSTMLSWTPHPMNLVMGRHLDDVVSGQARARHALERVLLGAHSHVRAMLNWEVIRVTGGDVVLCGTQCALHCVLFSVGGQVRDIVSWEVVGVVGGDVLLCIWMVWLWAFPRDHDARCRVVCVFYRLRGHRVERSRHWLGEGGFGGVRWDDEGCGEGGGGG